MIPLNLPGKHLLSHCSIHRAHVSYLITTKRHPMLFASSCQRAKNSNKTWLELGSRNVTAEIICPEVHQKLLKMIQNYPKIRRRKEEVQQRD